MSFLRGPRSASDRDSSGGFSQRQQQPADSLDRLVDEAEAHAQAEVGRRFGSAGWGSTAEEDGGENNRQSRSSDGLGFSGSNKANPRENSWGGSLAGGGRRNRGGAGGGDNDDDDANDYQSSGTLERSGENSVGNSQEMNGRRSGRAKSSPRRTRFQAPVNDSEDAHDSNDFVNADMEDTNASSQKDIRKSTTVISTSQEDVIPIIPDISEIETENLSATIAAPPSLKVNRVRTIKELETELEERLEDTFRGIDISLLTSAFAPVSHVTEEDKPWDFDVILTAVRPTIEALQAQTVSAATTKPGSRSLSSGQVTSELRTSGGLVGGDSQREGIFGLLQETKKKLSSRTRLDNVQSDSMDIETQLAARRSSRPGVNLLAD